MTSCPSETILRLIGTAFVGEPTFAVLEAHVEQCPDCQKILEATTRAVPPAKNPGSAWDKLPTLPGLVIERELGRGGTSVVYLALEPALKRHVAVKLIPKNSLVDPHAREHWLGEARALSRVPHDHVVAIHRAEETEEWLCLVIEFVSGGTLKDRLKGPLTPRDAARLAETIARAVGYFHTRGLAHLDLKPSNILLDGEPGNPWDLVSPRISDFGIARLEGEPGVTETGANGPRGTPSYMAPEQVAALPGTIGPAADLHALGAILYHLLTGRPPFQGASNLDTLEQVRSQDPAPPRRINGRIPRDLETICLTCLEKAPNRRYRTAEALAGDLRLWLEGRPISARRTSPMGHAWRLCRRNPAITGLLMALVMSLATGLAGLFVLLNQAEAERSRLVEARRRAEAYERFSANTAEELGAFLRTTLRNYRNPTPAGMAASLLSLRDSINHLRKQGLVRSSYLGILEAEIGWGLIYSNRPEEAWDLLNQAVADLKQYLSKDSENDEIRYYLGITLTWCAELANGKGQFEVALQYFEESANLRMSDGVKSKTTRSNATHLASIYKYSQNIIEHLGQDGAKAQVERARHLGRQILGYLAKSDLENSTGSPLADLGLLDRLFHNDSSKEMSSYQDAGIRYSHERFVAHWLALSVESLSPFHSPPIVTSYDRNPEAGAAALISAIRERCSKLGLENSTVPATVNLIGDQMMIEAASLRRLGRIDDARATAARFMTIARQLVRDYPDCALSFGVLCDAHDQIKKNAFQVRDNKVVLEALIQAVEAAHRGLTLDPERLEIRRKLDKLSVQLADARAEQNAIGSSKKQTPR